MNTFSTPIAIAEPLLANLPIGILVYDDDTGECVLANQAVAEMLGGSVEALRQQNFQTLASKCELAESALEASSSGPHEVSLPAASGKIITLDCFISRFDFQGQAQLLCTFSDITERKRTQEKLEQERSLLRCLIDSASDLIFIKDQDSVYRACNKASEAFIGIPESEQIGKTDYDFFDCTKAEEIREADSQVLSDGKPIHYEEWVTDREGRRLLMDTLKTPYYDPDGRPLGLVGIGRDLTERKHREEERLIHLKFLENMDRVNRAIQANNDLERIMSDVLGVVLTVFDCDRAFLLYPCDPHAQAWKVPMERTKPEYPGVLALGGEMPTDTKVAEIFRVLLSSDGPVKFGPGTEFPLPKEVSKKLDVKSSISMALHPKLGESWQFGLHQCSNTRIWTMEEERLFQEIGRRMEDALTSLLMHRHLRESEQRYRMLFENSPASVWEEDFSVVQTLFDDLKKQGVTDIEAWIDRHPELVRRCAASVKIVDVNRAAVALHGAANKEELFAGFIQTFTPESFDTFRQELVCLWHGGTELIADTVVRTLAGERRDVSVYFSVCPGYEQTLSKILVSIMNITDRKAAEDALRRLNAELDRRVLERTAELEAANKEMLSFTYTMSHDLRAPLRHIDGFLELLRKKAGGALDRQSRDYLNNISEAGHKMGRLVDDLLSFSRMSHHTISFYVVDLGNLVRDVMRELAPAVAGRTIDLRIGDLPVVTGDRFMLGMVLTNYIDNALKFTRPREKTRIEIGSRPRQDDQAEIYVRDNGVGFDMAHADKLFGVFQRLHRADEFEGTGIGLAIVRRIIARHGGRTWAEAKPDEGATFYFSLSKVDPDGI